MAGNENPFVAGARVAIRNPNPGFRQRPVGYKEAFVDKVYKTGNFTLKGDNQQWRLSHNKSAVQTGNHGWSSRPTLRIWDDSSNDEIAAENTKAALYQRFYNLSEAMRKIEFSDLVNDELLDQLEIVVLGLRPIPKE